LLGSEISAPKLYTEPDGSIRAEWTIACWEIDLIFDEQIEAIAHCRNDDSYTNTKFFTLTPATIQPLIDWIMPFAILEKK
jgi:hypothetical protein